MLMLLAAIAIIGAISALEMLWPARRDVSARGANLVAWVFTVISGLTLVPLASAASVLATNRLGGGLIDLSLWPLPLAAGVYVIAMDGAEYAFHRAQHAVPLLWRMHSLHHSDPNMNATSTVRHFWAEPLLKTVSIWFGMGLIFQPTPAVLLIYSACFLYHIVEHANLPIGFGRWSWLLNSPAYHRVHHSSDPEDFTANYAGLLPIFDVIFGTFRRPTDWKSTGLATQPRGALDIAIWPLRRMPARA